MAAASEAAVIFLCSLTPSRTAPEARWAHRIVELLSGKADAAQHVLEAWILAQRIHEGIRLNEGHEVIAVLVCATEPLERPVLFS